MTVIKVEGKDKNWDLIARLARKPILSVNEAAIYLDVSPKTILQEINEGTIPAVKIGRSWRIHRATLDKLISQGTPPRQPPPSGEEPAELVGTEEEQVRT